MSRENSPLGDSGEIIFNPRSVGISEDASQGGSDFRNSCSPDLSSAPTASENVNELLLKAIETMNRDVVCMKQDLGEELSHIRETSRGLQERIGMLENNVNVNSQSEYGRHTEHVNPRHLPFVGAGESFHYDRVPYPPFQRVNRNENSRQNMVFNPKPTVSLKPQTYDGSEDFEEYLSQFKILVDLHGWDYCTKSLYLASSLTGNARAVLGELSEIQIRDFDSLVKVLSMRYGSVERSEMFRAKLKNRVMGTKESLSELSQSIKKLVRQAYPTGDPNLLNILALDHFIDALPDPNMRLRLRESRVRDIGEAEIMAIRLETYKMADAQRQKPINVVSSHAPKDENKEIISLLKNIQDTLSQTNQNSQNFGRLPQMQRNPSFRNCDNGRSYQNRYNGGNNQFRNHNMGIPQWKNHRFNDSYHSQNRDQSNGQTSGLRGESRRPMATSLGNSQ